MKGNQQWFHNGTVNLTIKNIPETVCKTLKRTARENGRSLNAEVIRGLTRLAEEENRRRDLGAWLAEARRFKATLRKMPDSVPLIRAERRRRG